MKFPEHLRKETTILQPETDVTNLKKIGEEVTEILDYTPGELYVKQYIRPKYVVLKEIKEWMIAEYPKVLPSSIIGNAIAYSLKRWEKLCVYTTDGRLCIDSNPVENAVRPVAIGTKICKAIATEFITLMFENTALQNRTRYEF